MRKIGCLFTGGIAATYNNQRLVAKDRQGTIARGTISHTFAFKLGLTGDTKLTAGSNPPARELTVTQKLNLGCGGEHLAGWVNVDKFAAARPDVVHDLERFPWPFPDGCAGEVLLKHGVRIPEEVSLVGFGNILTAAHFRVPLTTIRSPKYRLGLAAMEALASLLRGAQPVTAPLTAELLVRQSTARPPATAPATAVAAG